MHDPPSCRILDVEIHRLTLANAVAAVNDFVISARPHQVATVNLDFLRIAQRDLRFHQALNGADLAVADGMPLVWLSRLLGQPLAERVAGVDLVQHVATLAADRGYSLFLLGAEPGVADEAAAALVQRNPGLRIAGTYAPPFGPFSAEEDAEMVARVHAARPDILCVAFGAPRQEIWLADHLELLHAPVCIGVGGTLDFIAGRIPRAPLWIQRRGLEWAFRLWQEPKRLWRRYLLGDLPLFVRALWGSAFVAERRAGAGAAVEKQHTP